MNVENLSKRINKKNERPGREIKISSNLLGNDNVSIKIGTAEDKNSPKTVYINITFWVDIKNRQDEQEEFFDKKISREYSKELSNIYKKELKELLLNHKLFPYYYENIFIYDFPENLNYNKKRSFTSIELNLHTSNCDSKNPTNLPLKNKKNTEIFDELLIITKKIIIHKKSQTHTQREIEQPYA